VEKLDSAQLDQLKEIGAYLRQVRQEQSKSLEEIATKTCIRLPLLRAIELGQEQVLPEPVFVQGFIRRYADILGLDGTGLSRTFPVHSVLESSGIKVKEATPAPAAIPIEPMEESKYSMRSSREFVSTSESVLRSQGAYALYAAIGVLAFSSLAYVLFNSKPDPSEVVSPNLPSFNGQQPSPIAVSSSPISPTSAQGAGLPSGSASPSPKTNTIPSPAMSNSPVSIAVELTGRSWLQVVTDGSVEFEGTLDKGTQRNWSAKREITVVAGDAGAVSVKPNSGAAKVMGRSGDVKEMTVTPSTR
jgi:cytoskeleton protein RodZ